MELPKGVEVERLEVWVRKEKKTARIILTGKELRDNEGEAFRELFQRRTNIALQSMGN